MDFFTFIDPSEIRSQTSCCSNSDPFRCNIPTPKCSSKKHGRSCGAFFADLWVLPNGAQQNVEQDSDPTCDAIGSLTIAGMNLALGPGLAGNGAVMAFSLPSLSWPEGWTKDSLVDYWTTMPTNVTAQWHSKGILAITAIQGVHSASRIMHGDIFGGTYGIMLSLLGYRARMPGPARVWLKTYVLITFINGIVGGLEFAQQVLLHTLPKFSLALPWHVNLINVLSVANPATAFLGAYFGWQFIKCLKKLAMEDYQQRLAMYGAQPGAPGLQAQGMQMQMPMGLPANMTPQQMAEAMQQMQKMAAAQMAQQAQGSSLESIPEENEEEEDEPSAEVAPDKEDKDDVATVAPSVEAVSVGDEKEPESGSVIDDDGPVIQEVN